MYRAQFMIIRLAEAISRWNGIIIIKELRFSLEEANISLIWCQCPLRVVMRMKKRIYASC